MSTVKNALPLPEVYYNARTKDYFIPNDRKQWISVNEGSVKRHLKSQGYLSKCVAGEPLSQLEQCLADIQQKQDVQYAASLAGYKAGLYEINERRILVTDSPKLIEPAPGKWPLLEEIFEGMFNDSTTDQRPYFFGWLKVALED